MTENYVQPRVAPPRRRSNRQVWIAVAFAIAGLIPAFGIYFGLTACVCALFAIFGHGYSVRQRVTAVITFVLGFTLAAFWFVLFASGLGI